MELFVFRKMLKNKWMVLCLIVGSLLSITMVSCIPVYSDGVLQRMLISDMDEYQASPFWDNSLPETKEQANMLENPLNRVNYEEGKYAGNFIVSVNLEQGYDPVNRGLAFSEINNVITTNYVSQLGLPILSKSVGLVANNMRLLNPMTGIDKYVTVNSQTDMAKHIDIIDGRMPSTKVENGVVEVMVMQQGLKKMGLVTGTEYDIQSTMGSGTFKVKVVGVFVPKNEPATIFNKKDSKYTLCLYVDPQVMQSEFIDKATKQYQADPAAGRQQYTVISAAEFYYVLDYHALNLAKLHQVDNVVSDMTEYFSKYNSITLNVPMLAILNDYFVKEKNLNNTLLVIQAPILLLLAFYIYMISALIVEFDKNEISVLRSRGASRWQVIRIYLLQGTIISGIGLAVGVPLSQLICYLLGVPDGFLNLAHRTAMETMWSTRSLIFGIIAAAFVILTIVLPVIFASTVDIIELKRSKQRRTKIEKWKLYGVDFILLAISAYGYFTYTSRQTALLKTSASGQDIPVDPLVFLSIIAFIAGAGLLFMRLYPLVVMGVFKLGKRIFSPQAYCATVQVGRGKGQMSIIMMFLMLTMSVSLFNANAARTVNTSREDVVSHQLGADMVVMADWTRGSDWLAQLDPSLTDDPSFMAQQEPPYTAFQNLKGISGLSKVYKTNECSITSGQNSMDNVVLEGVEPNQMAPIIWFRQDLLPFDIMDYLNCIATNKQGIIISSNIAKEMKLKVGDTFKMLVGSHARADVMVYGIAKYWPTFNTNKEADKNFMIANFDYVVNSFGITPYEVWMKLDGTKTPAQVVDQLTKAGIVISYEKDLQKQLSYDSKSAIRMGTNGILTLGFIVTIAAFIIGFLIYWILSIKSRSLQFGILRAMGMKTRQVIAMLAYEQVLLSGAAIVVGIFLGGLASKLFIPFLQVAYSAAEQMPPFRVVMNMGDYIEVYSITCIALIAAFSVLGSMIARLNINSAIKLGED